MSRYSTWLSGALVVGALQTLTAAAVAQDRTITVEPGLWRFTNSFTVPGLSEGQEFTTTECLTEETARLSLQEVLREMTGSDGNCAISNLVELPGKVELDIVCEVDAGGAALRSTGHMRYAYSRTAFEGGADGVIEMQGQQLPYAGRGTGSRIGDCTGG